MHHPGKAKAKMGLLKKVEKKPLKSIGRGGAGGSVSALRPQQVAKRVPCTTECPSGTHIREWIQIIAQREKTKTGEDEAFTRAWLTLVETNPFPAVMGRVCPHPCETKCNRQAKDGAVNINALERFIGDWAIAHRLELPRVAHESPKQESVGVIGAGPAGLSFAYQMARRGYPVTVYEKSSKAGGMLYWGIPFYRLPADVLEAEVQRILALGVELRLNTTVGKDVSVEDLKARHKILFLGIGADKGRLMKVPGEEGPNVWTGTDYLFRVNNGDHVDVGKNVVVIGGGDTAIDAARAARRAGAEVTILYRRTRVEMPAIDSEIEDALKEGVKIEYLVAPVGVRREGDKLRHIVVQKMELGEPDESGRRRPVPIEGSEYEIPVSAIIAAISQEPNWEHLDALRPESRWLTADPHGKVADGLWTGGDVLNLGLATIAIGQGRVAAEAAHAEMRGLEGPRAPQGSVITQERLKLDFYEPKPRVERSHRPVEEWLTKPEDEIALGLSKDQFLEEVSRCFSCGLCFGCERCWMYCTPSCFSKVQAPFPGEYYKIKLDTCDGCKKCADECPCGFLDMI
jgi:NADPH-dependent glutamate synthase beta subunit-like oxidoreductase/Pyruvate/2-oxoacid:ferredoxin oxidoreductase delta subunit